MDNSLLNELEISGVSKKLTGLCLEAEAEIKHRFDEIDKIAEFNQLKVLKAMQKNRLSDTHLFASTGYGYNDAGRDTLERIYSCVFKSEAALVRPQIVSGTHALTIALSGNLKHGEELVYVTGAPYDTLLGVIGVRETRGSLISNGINYKQVELKNNYFDFDGIKNAISKNTKIVAIQRSKGYSFRHSFLVSEIAEIIEFINKIKNNNNIRKDLIIMVDNCYGEFVDVTEPSEFGADMTVGSLIKNIGGGLSPVGGYIAGTEECVENAAARLTSPGLGREVGPGLGVISHMLQGLFIAPVVTSSAVKGAVLASAIFGKLGYQVEPVYNEKRADIVQAINMKSAEELIKFCGGIQSASPVDSFVTPEPWDMPGYDCKVIMAAGAFIQGSSIELSADAPIRPPYTVFLQGGLTYAHAKIGLLTALSKIIK